MFFRGSSTPEAMAARVAAAARVGYEFHEFRGFYALNPIDWRDDRGVFNLDTLTEIDDQIRTFELEKENGTANDP